MTKDEILAIKAAGSAADAEWGQVADFALKMIEEQKALLWQLLGVAPEKPSPLPDHLVEIPHYACRECHAHGRVESIDGTWVAFDGHHAGCSRYIKDGGTCQVVDLA